MHVVFETPRLILIDLGYRLQQNAWRKGYATEAAKYTLAHGLIN